LGDKSIAATNKMYLIVFINFSFCWDILGFSWLVRVKSLKK